MAMKAPAQGSSEVWPVITLRRRTPVTTDSPRISSTTEFQMKASRSFLKARSCMIFEARSLSRRWTTLTLVANLVRKVASSIAVSPPPTTTSSLPRKKNPSQVAQVETPCPMRRPSPGTPIFRAEAPEAMISVLACNVASASTVIVRGGRVTSTAVISPLRNSVPKRSAWARISFIRSGPMIA